MSNNTPPVFKLSKSSPVFNLGKTSNLDQLFCGLSWNTKFGSNVDLDLSALFYSESGVLLCDSSFSNAKQRLMSGAVWHYGDDLTGSDMKTDTDNERIKIDVSMLPSECTQVIIVGTLYSGTFKAVSDCTLNLRDSNNKILVSCDLTDGSSTGIVLGSIVISSDGNVDVNYCGKDFAFKTSKGLSSYYSCESILDPLISLVGSTAPGSNFAPDSRPGLFSRLFGRG